MVPDLQQIDRFERPQQMILDREPDIAGKERRKAAILESQHERVLVGAELPVSPLRRWMENDQQNTVDLQRIAGAPSLPEGPCSVHCRQVFAVK